ncbi:hypothetical protein TURU_089289 [Turdus rufiventris]|nr:hypothetical protein TURU_089289 [Turdus rufiventris]
MQWLLLMFPALLLTSRELMGSWVGSSPLHGADDVMDVGHVDCFPYNSIVNEQTVMDVAVMIPRLAQHLSLHHYGVLCLPARKGSGLGLNGHELNSSPGPKLLPTSSSTLSVGLAHLQKDLDSLGKGAERNLIELSKEKYKVLHLGQNSSMLPYRLWANQPENDMAEKGPECPGGQADHEPAILPHGKKG